MDELASKGAWKRRCFQRASERAQSTIAVRFLKSNKPRMIKERIQGSWKKDGLPSDWPGRCHYGFAPEFGVLAGAILGPSPMISLLDFPTGGAVPTSGSLQPSIRETTAHNASASRHQRVYLKLRRSFMIGSPETIRSI
jgi:hypothetical protein